MIALLTRDFDAPIRLAASEKLFACTTRAKITMSFKSCICAICFQKPRSRSVRSLEMDGNSVAQMQDRLVRQHATRSRFSTRDSYGLLVVHRLLGHIEFRRGDIEHTHR